MSTLHVPDDILQRLGATAGDALVEIACRLYETQSLPFDQAARLAPVGLEQCAEQCARRNIPVYWYSADDVARDLKTLERMGL